MHAFLWSFVGVIWAVGVLASRREEKHICFWRVVVVVQVLYYCATCSIDIIIIIIMFFFFGSFELNLVLWCDVVVVGDSFQISWLILKFLCRHQQQHLEQKFFERAFEDCTLIVLLPVSAFFNGTALPSSLAYIQTINAERPWRFCAAHLIVSLEALHRCSSWLLFFAHKKTSFLTLLLLLVLLGERSCC
jgi:hypothetical protein